MIFDVHMMTYQPDYCVRHVDVPDDELGTLEQNRAAVWQYGQNMFQNVPGICSVSAGDVMQFDDEYHMILGYGFLVLNAEQFEAYKVLPQEDRRRLLWEEDEILKNLGF